MSITKTTICSLVIITLLLLPTVSSGFTINLHLSTTTTTTTTTRQYSILSHRCDTQKEEEEKEELYNEIYKKIQLIASELWKGDEIIPSLQASSSSPANNNNNNNNNNTTIFSFSEGEAELEPTIIFSERCSYFKNKAIHTGCPKSQHSYGLLLWSGFSTTTTTATATTAGGSTSSSASDAVLSAKFHSAAALQHHLDGIAIMGGIVRTGTGIPKKFKNVELGIKIIDYCASVGNPAGINKKAALLEKEDNYVDAVQLYENSILNGRINALLLFNLGWCLINGRNENNKKDSIRGIQLWKDAAALAPDQGSEEAAWFLYKEYVRDDPKEAQYWYDLAMDLGYYE
jgi:hypothetical protein